MSTRDGDEHADAADPAPGETAVTASSTGHGGQPSESVENPADPVKSALARARKLARGTGRTARRTRGRQPAEPGRNTGGYSGAHPDSSDPQPLGSVLAGYTEDRGWERPLAEARVLADWAGIVGADVAAHCTPTALRDGELRISAQSTAWAQQLQLLRGHRPGPDRRRARSGRRHPAGHHRPDRAELEAREAVGAGLARAARHLWLIARARSTRWRAQGRPCLHPSQHVCAAVRRVESPFCHRVPIDWTPNRSGVASRVSHAPRPPLVRV